jgi:hypothetical protein
MDVVQSRPGSSWRRPGRRRWLLFVASSVGNARTAVLRRRSSSTVIGRHSDAAVSQDGTSFSPNAQLGIALQLADGSQNFSPEQVSRVTQSSLEHSATSSDPSGHGGSAWGQ